MRMFSSLKVLMFLGIVFVFVGSTVHAQEDSLEVLTAGGAVGIGDPVDAIFVVDPAQVVNLRITWSGMNITSISGATAPFANGGSYATSLFGTLEIGGDNNSVQCLD